MSVLRFTYSAPDTGWMPPRSVVIGGLALASAVGQSHTTSLGRSRRGLVECRVPAEHPRAVGARRVQPVDDLRPPDGEVGSGNWAVISSSNCRWLALQGATFGQLHVPSGWRRGSRR